MLTRRAFAVALLILPVPVLAQPNVAYVDFIDGKYWAVFNGRRYGPYNTRAEAWAKLRQLGA